MGGEANKNSAEINTLVEQNMVATEQAMMLRYIRRDLEGRQGSQISRPSWPDWMIVKIKGKITNYQ